MFKLFSIQTITALLFLSSLSHSQYNALPRNFGLYEPGCSSSRQEFSKRVLDIGLEYCTKTGDQNPHLDGCQLVKPSVYKEPSFDECLPEEINKSSETLYLGTGPYAHEAWFFLSTLLGAHLWDEDEDEIKKENKNQTPPAYYWCESPSSNNPKKMGKEARSCIDENYIKGITKAFNEMAECFDLNDYKIKKRLFAKYYVESRLFLRKVEDRPDTETMKSTNRCFGQIKNGLIETLNQYIHFRDTKDPNVSEYYGDYINVYKQALNKCPFLSNLSIPRPSTLKGTSLNKPSPKEDSTFKKAHKKEKNSIICKTSQDPYACLFYSMFNARRNLIDITKQLEKLKQSEDYKISFYINDIPLFKNEEDLKWSFVFWAHNGGNTVIKKGFSKFIEDLKDSIIDPQDGCEKQGLCVNKQSSKCVQCISKYKKYQESFSNRKPLTTPILHKEFSAFIKENKNIVNPKEVSDFMNKIKTQLPSLSSRAKIRLALNYLYKDKDCVSKECDNKEYDEEEMNKLIESTEENCPINIGKIFDYN